MFPNRVKRSPKSSSAPALISASRDFFLSSVAFLLRKSVRLVYDQLVILSCSSQKATSVQMPFIDLNQSCIVSSTAATCSNELFTWGALMVYPWRRISSINLASLSVSSSTDLSNAA